MSGLRGSEHYRNGRFTHELLAVPGGLSGDYERPSMAVRPVRRQTKSRELARTVALGKLRESRKVTQVDHATTMPLRLRRRPRPSGAPVPWLFAFGVLGDCLSDAFA